MGHLVKFTGDVGSGKIKQAINRSSVLLEGVDVFKDIRLFSVDNYMIFSSVQYKT